MAKVVTQTGLTHYEVQKKRRADSVQESRDQRSPVVIHPSDVTMVDTPRGMRTGVYMGTDGDRPTRVLDALQHELHPESTTTVHRHSWDAIMFITEGSGWTEINGRRIEWHPWDTVYLPSWAWHRHGNESNKKAQFVTWGVEPMYETFGVAVLEEAGDTPYSELPPPPAASSAGPGGFDPYSRRMQRLSGAHWTPEEYRLNTRWEDITPRVTSGAPAVRFSSIPQSATAPPG
jgi:quercetin dioxygenase-like cupin family protein